MPSYFVRDVASASSFYPPVLHQSKLTNGLIEQQQQQQHDCIGNSGDVRSASQLQLRKQHNTLNVNGKKFYRNKDKTIWSYNPDDFLIRSVTLKSRLKNQEKFYGANNNSTFESQSNINFDTKNDSAKANNHNTSNNLKSTSYYYFPPNNDDDSDEDEEINRMPKGLNTIDSFNYSLNRLYLDSQLYQLIPVITNTTTAATSTSTSTTGIVNKENSRFKQPNKDGKMIELEKQANTAPTTTPYRLTTPSQLIERYSNINALPNTPPTLSVKNNVLPSQTDTNTSVVNLEKEKLKVLDHDDDNLDEKLFNQNHSLHIASHHKTTNSTTNLNEDLHLDEKTNESEENNVDLRKLGSKANDGADEYLKLRLNHYKTSLSKIIKNRYTTEPFLMQQSTAFKYQQQQQQQQQDSNKSTNFTQSKQVNKSSPKHMPSITRINKSIGPFYEQQQQQQNQAVTTKPTENIVVYNKNIDNLTADLLSAFSNGINKELIARERTPTAASSSQIKLNNILSSHTVELSHTSHGKANYESGYRAESSIKEEVDMRGDSEIDSNKSGVKNVNMDTFYPENYSCTDNFSDQEDDFPDDDEDDEFIDDEYFDDENQPSDYEDERIIFGTNINDRGCVKNYPESQNIVMKICNGIKSYDIGENNNNDRQRNKILNKLKRQKQRRKLNRRPKSGLDNENSNFNKTIIDENNISSAQNQLASEIRERVSANLNRLDFQNEYPANYFERRKKSIHYWDKYHNLDENRDDYYDFEYGEVISDEFRQVFDRYDATLTADQFIKQQLPPPQYYLPKIQNTKLLPARQQQNEINELKPTSSINNESSNKDPGNILQDNDSGISATSVNQNQSKANTPSANPQSKFEMYHILKRMMVKKKYVLATIKIEKEANNKKPRLKRALTNINAQANVAKPRPITATIALEKEVNSQQTQPQQPQQQFQKLSRPKTVNMPLNQLSNTAQSSDYNNNNNQVDMISSLDQNLKNALDEDFFYEPFRISPSTINNQQWPFEIDFDKSFSKNSSNATSQKNNNRQQLSKNSKNSNNNNNNKCYPCKKLPLIKTANSVDKNEQTVSNEQYSRIYTLQNHHHLRREMYSSYGNAGLTGTSNLIMSTYNSTRRCVSAKMLQNPVQHKVYTSRPVYDSVKTTLDNLDEMNRNNYNSDYEIDKEIDDEDDVYSKRNVLVNKEEHMRRMSVMPGKSFRSQRTKSISIDHVPVSNKKLDSQKARIPFGISSKNNNNNNNQQQQLLQLQQQQAQQNNQGYFSQKSFMSSLSCNTKNNLTSSGSSVADLNQSTANNNNNNNNNNKLSSLALAIQHQEEIYSLIDQKTLKNFNLAAAAGHLTQRSIKPNKQLRNEITTILYKKTNKLHNSRSKIRPKTSKT